MAEYERCFLIDLIKEAVVAAWIREVKIETKYLNGLLICIYCLDVLPGVRLTSVF